MSGGGDGDPMQGGGGTATPTRAMALTDSATATNAAVKMAQAAEAQPTPGSVTQSSNVDSSRISLDKVEVTAQYRSGTPTFSVSNGIAWSISTSDGNPSRISGTSSPWKGVELAKRITGGTLYVDAYTDIEAPTPSTSGQPVNVMVGDHIVAQDQDPDLDSPVPGSLNGVAGIFNCPGSCEVEILNDRVVSVSGVVFTPTATSASSDTDYLAGGVWLIVPDDATSPHRSPKPLHGDGIHGI